MSTFSVIVPVYHGEQYVFDIIQQIESCKKCLGNEDYIEVLFVNDAPEAPLDSKWKSEVIDIRIINTDRNMGIHGARVKGLKQCKGDYILFLDQDDKIVPEYFKSQMEALGEKDAVVCKALNGGKEEYADNTYFLNMPYKRFTFKEWNLILSPGQVLIKRKYIPDIWMKNILKNNGADDWFLWICMLAGGCQISLNDNFLYEHVIHDNNVSKDTMSMLCSEQEMLELIHVKKIVSDDDFGLLLKGFNKKNRWVMQKLNNAGKKLDYIEKWLKWKLNNEKFRAYLSQLDFQKIAIYGCGVLGEYIYEELKSYVDKIYFIDRNAAHIQKNVPVYTLTKHLPEVDCVILTLIEETEDVEVELKKNGFKNIILLKDWKLM